MSLDLDSVRIFLRVAELASFTHAADQLRIPKSKASLEVRALEEQLGVRLFQRTTRMVRLTADGEKFLVRARRLAADAEDLESMFSAPSMLKGPVRIDLPVAIARNVVFPRLPELLTLHPRLELLVSTTDRRVEVAREGFDCVLRVGAMPDSGLVGKRLGVLPMANYVSPGYLHQRGVPRAIDDLDDHFVVHYSQTLGADEPSFEWVDGAEVRERPMRALLTVNSTDAYEGACIAGLGIIQAPKWGPNAALESGLLLEVLPDFRCASMPVTLVHAHGRNVPRRVRAVMGWLAGLLEPLLA